MWPWHFFVRFTHQAGLKQIQAVRPTNLFIACAEMWICCIDCSLPSVKARLMEREIGFYFFPPFSHWHGCGSLHLCAIDCGKDEQVLRFSSFISISLAYYVFVSFEHISCWLFPVVESIHSFFRHPLNWQCSKNSNREMSCEKPNDTESRRKQGYHSTAVVWVWTADNTQIQ